MHASVWYMPNEDKSKRSSRRLWDVDELLTFQATSKTFDISGNSAQLLKFRAVQPHNFILYMYFEQLFTCRVVFPICKQPLEYLHWISTPIANPNFLSISFRQVFKDRKWLGSISYSSGEMNYPDIDRTSNENERKAPNYQVCPYIVVMRPINPLGRFLFWFPYTIKIAVKAYQYLP
jgi:hypothetical protein